MIDLSEIYYFNNKKEPSNFFNFHKGVFLFQTNDFFKAMNSFQMAYIENDDLSILSIAYYYLAEARLYANEEATKYLKIIIKDHSNIHKIIIAELYFLLALEYKRIQLLDEYETFIGSAMKYSDKNISLKQFNLISMHSVDRNNNSPELRLKGKELHLYNALKKNPLKKFDLVELIYGLDCDVIKSEKKFKSLLNRLRKKIPDAIILNTNEYYQLIVTNENNL